MLSCPETDRAPRLEFQVLGLKILLLNRLPWTTSVRFPGPLLSFTFVAF